MTDCMDLYELLTSAKGLSNDKSQRLVILSLREYRQLGIIRATYHCPTALMLADGLTKVGNFPQLLRYCTTGLLVLNYKPEQFFRLSVGPRRIQNTECLDTTTNVLDDEIKIPKICGSAPRSATLPSTTTNHVFTPNTYFIFDDRKDIGKALTNAIAIFGQYDPLKRDRNSPFAHPPPGSPKWRKVLYDFYKRYNPRQLPKLHDILQCYHNNELTLYNELILKYQGNAKSDHHFDKMNDGQCRLCKQQGHWGNECPTRIPQHKSQPALYVKTEEHQYIESSLPATEHQYWKRRMDKSTTEQPPSDPPWKRRKTTTALAVVTTQDDNDDDDSKPKRYQLIPRTPPRSSEPEQALQAISESSCSNLQIRGSASRATPTDPYACLLYTSDAADE